MDGYYKTLLDEYACRRLQERYWRALSEHDANGLANGFTADGQWGSAKGRDAIIEAAEQIFEGLDALQFMSTSVGSIRIDIDGDSASGSIEGIAHHVVKGKAGPRIVVADALYYLQWKREADGWKIASMTGKLHPDALHDGAFQFNLPMATIDYGIPAEE